MKTTFTLQSIARLILVSKMTATDLRNKWIVLQSIGIAIWIPLFATALLAGDINLRRFIICITLTLAAIITLPVVAIGSETKDANWVVRAAASLLESTVFIVAFLGALGILSIFLSHLFLDNIDFSIKFTPVAAVVIILCVTSGWVTPHVDRIRHAFVYTIVLIFLITMIYFPRFDKDFNIHLFGFVFTSDYLVLLLEWFIVATGVAVAVLGFRFSTDDWVGWLVLFGIFFIVGIGASLVSPFLVRQLYWEIVIGTYLCLIITLFMLTSDDGCKSAVTLVVIVAPFVFAGSALFHASGIVIATIGVSVALAITNVIRSIAWWSINRKKDRYSTVSYNEPIVSEYYSARVLAALACLF